MKKFVAFLVALPLLFGSLTACGSNDGAQYAGVCVDPNTNVRLDDSNCSGGDSGGGFGLTEGILLYMLLSSNHSYPAVGYPVQRNYFVSHIPSGSSYTYGVPRTGGSSLKSWSKKKFGSGYKAPASKSYNSNGKKVTLDKPKSTPKSNTNKPKSNSVTPKKKSSGSWFGGSKKSSGGWGSSKSFGSKRR